MDTDVAFFFAGLKQRSIFQHLHEKGITWKNYEASSASGFAPDSRFYSWTSGHLDRVVALSNFYTDAKSGALPQFSYLNPECCSQFSYHPPSPVSKGEAFVKQVYEAVRNGPDWNHTALIITFDEHGGFADHVPPPPAPKPGDGLPYNWKGGNGGASGIFEFDRYGVRVPTFLISPYVPAGLVQHGNDTGAQYDHTSILKFVETLWGLPALTNRDKNARDLVDLFTLSSPRGDCPTVI
ncbi:hypothetical protein HDU79_002641 [Rhizoclosmatium sp. JEL0117]|nr:hypothetical protein HDU79_002641 [Rhizoclosmatium sp. JEL0117]